MFTTRPNFNYKIDEERDFKSSNIQVHLFFRGFSACQVTLGNFKNQALKPPGYQLRRNLVVRLRPLKETLGIILISSRLKPKTIFNKKSEPERTRIFLCLLNLVFNHSTIQIVMVC